MATDGVEPAYVKEEVLPEFFKHFWVRRMALDRYFCTKYCRVGLLTKYCRRRNYKQLVETTVEIALRVGVAEVVTRVVDDLKDESEPYRRMVSERV